MSFDSTPFGARLARHEWQTLLDRWQRLQPNADRFATVFFDTLFAWEPELRQFFGGASLEAQFLRFAHLLTEIVSAAGEPDELDHRVELVVQRFARDDSATDQSRAMKAAIAAMLDEVAVADMTRQMRADWKAAYVAVATMLRGTRFVAARSGAGTLLQTAMRAEIAADRHSTSIERLMESAADAEAA
jgi:hemoglobin-like flavoprotein